jgi:hypothetical protein
VPHRRDGLALSALVVISIFIPGTLPQACGECCAFGAKHKPFGTNASTTAFKCFLDSIRVGPQFICGGSVCGRNRLEPDRTQRTRLQR